MHNQPPDLMTVIAQGSMRAAALIAADRGITPDPEALTRALRDQITEGWREAANDAREACYLSEEHGRQSLNLSCNLFAYRALRQLTPEIEHCMKPLDCPCFHCMRQA